MPSTLCLLRPLPCMQAANIQEALEAGATTLLIDEDTSATNFMIRDARMQARLPLPPAFFIIKFQFFSNIRARQSLCGVVVAWFVWVWGWVPAGRFTGQCLI